MTRRLITDLDLLSGRVTGPIVLGPGVLLTPAARDRAVARGVAIVGPGEGGSRPYAVAPAAPRPPETAASSPAPHGCACGRPPPLPTSAACDCAARAGAAPGLPDGLLLVRVEAGATVWFRTLAGEVPARPPG